MWGKMQLQKNNAAKTAKVKINGFPEIDANGILWLDVTDEVKTTEPPVQNDVLPLALIVGIDGKAFTVTSIATLLLSSPFALTWLT